MKEKFDVIIVGGSYSGLAAAMALARALRKVMIIDGGKPANRFTPQSHNFITHDGRPPDEIAALAREQVDDYPNVKRVDGFVIDAKTENHEFAVQLDTGQTYISKKLIFATGIIDQLPLINGISDCWGKSVLHCPYCHGYEVRNLKTGIIGNGEYAFEFGSLISNWTHELSIFTNGASSLTEDQRKKLNSHSIEIIEHKIKSLQHERGYLSAVEFENGNIIPLTVIYTRPEFEQHCAVPVQLGCELTLEGYIKIDASQKTTVDGVYACGDNITRLRTVCQCRGYGYNGRDDGE